MNMKMINRGKVVAEPKSMKIETGGRLREIGKLEQNVRKMGERCDIA